MALDQQYSYTATGNHAVSISLMYDSESKFKPYFIFLNLAPGEKTDSGGRTFNYSNTVSLKLDLGKLAELSFALAAFARGQAQAVGGKFSLFVDGTKSSYGSGEKKSVMLNYNNDEKYGPQVSMNFKAGDRKANAFIMTPTAALALSEVCKKVFNKGMELDMNRGSVSYTKSTTQNQKPKPSSGTTEERFTQAASAATGTDDAYDPFEG